MIVLSGVWIEAKLLHRSVRSWWLGGSVAWLALVRMQEPPGLRSAHVPFYWAAAEVALLLTTALVPLVWAVLRGPDATSWMLRTARLPARTVLVCWLGITAYGVVGSAGCAILSVTVDRIFGSSLALDRALLLWLEAVMLVLPLAALAPAVAFLRLTVPSVTLLWLLVLGASLTLGIPVPTGALLILQDTGPTMARLTAPAVVAMALATAGGFALATALAQRRS